MNSAREKRDFFDRLAPEWDAFGDAASETARLRTLSGMLPFHQGDTILDVGCGTGRLIQVLRSMVGETGLLLEIDYSLAMLQAGRKKRSPHGLHFIQADAHVLPFADHSFDGIVCYNLFPHLTEKAAALTQFHRVLKPGRSLVIWHLAGSSELNEFHSRLQGPVRHDRLPGSREMALMMKECGFRNPEVSDKPSLYLAIAAA